MMGCQTWRGELDINTLDTCGRLCTANTNIEGEGTIISPQFNTFPCFINLNRFKQVGNNYSSLAQNIVCALKN